MNAASTAFAILIFMVALVAILAVVIMATPKPVTPWPRTAAVSVYELNWDLGRGCWVPHIAGTRDNPVRTGQKWDACSQCMESITEKDLYVPCME